MTMTIQNDTASVVILARVEGDRVVEYPLTAEAVASRDHSRAMYYPVEVISDDFTNEAGLTVKTTMTVDHNRKVVTVKHSVVERDLEECVQFFRASLSGGNWQPKKVNEVPPGEINHFEKVVGKHLEAKLEKMVQERYSSLDSLLGRYGNSTNPVWKKEADYVQKLLDQTWVDLIDYFASLRSGLRPLPVVVVEIDAAFDSYSWDKLPA